MSRKSTLSLVAVAAVLLLSAGAAAGDSSALKFNSPAVCKTEGGSTVDLSPGRYLPEQDWQKLDDKWKVMEDNNTRLKAENKSYRESESMVGWKTAAATAVLGVVLGRYALDK